MIRFLRYMLSERAGLREHVFAILWGTTLVTRPDVGFSVEGGRV